MSRLPAEVPSTSWAIGELEGIEVKWFELVGFAVPARSLGVLSDKSWVLAFERDEKCLLHAPEGAALEALLPILQRDLADVEELIRRRLQVESSAGGWLFPIDLVYRAALRSGSSYWIGAAAIWMEHATPLTLNRSELQESAGLKNLDQQTKHRLWKIAKRIGEQPHVEDPLSEG